MVNKDKIIMSASRLFVDKGFGKTTMEDIAKDLGIYKGSLYHHIKSKAGIFYEILMIPFNQTLKKMEKIGNENIGSEEKLRKLISAHFENIQKYSLEYQVLLSERRHMINKMQEKIIRRKMKRYENVFVKIIGEGIKRKVFRKDLNPRVTVAGIIGIGNTIYKWFSPNGPLSFQAITYIYTEFFLNGIKIHKQK